MKMSEQFAGNYFKATDLPQPRVLTIQNVTQEKMPEGDTKPVVRFVGEAQQLVLNKTNAFVCVELFGDETAAWHGQTLELYSTTTNFSGRMVPCIRVRAPQAPAAAMQQAAPAPQPVQQPVPQAAAVPQPMQQQPVPHAPQPAPVQIPVPQPGTQAAQQFVQPQVPQQPPMQAPAADYPVDA